MGKHKQSSGTRKSETIKVSKRIRANINIYKSQSYCHFTDLVKDKSVSMNLESVKRLCKALPKILKSMENMQQGNNSSSSSSASESD